MIACPQRTDAWPLSRAVRLDRAEHWEQARQMIADNDYSGLVVASQPGPEGQATRLPLIPFRTFQRLRDLGNANLLGVWLQALAENQRVEREFHSESQLLAAIQRSLPELTKQQEHAHQLFQNSPTPSLILCRNASILEINHRAAEILGRSERELLGISLLTCLKESSVADILNLFWSCLRGERLETATRINLRLKDGKCRPVKVSAGAFQAGEVKRVHLSLNEDTCQSAFDGQAIFDRLAEGLLSLNESGQILASNQRAQELLGYSRAELAGRELNSVGLQQRSRKEEQTVWLSQSSGRKLLAEVRALWRAGPGRARQVLSLRDLSARRKALQELMEIRESQLADLGQELHDDLGQVLTALTYLAEILSKNLHKRPLLESLANEVVSMARDSVRKTRSLARILYPSVLERNGLASALRDLASSTEEAFGIECQCRTAQINLPRLSALHLFRIAQAAVSNAVQHSQAGRITLRLLRGSEPDQIKLEISDDGKGMQDSILKGHGILDMEHRCEALQGRLTIQSQAGQGTSVTCLVPILEPHSF